MLIRCLTVSHLTPVALEKGCSTEQLLVFVDEQDVSIVVMSLI